jgi:hypothetical protein
MGWLCRAMGHNIVLVDGFAVKWGIPFYWYPTSGKLEMSSFVMCL